MKKIYMIVLLGFIPALAISQTTYFVSPDTKVTLSGTSTLHDWTSNVNEVEGNVEIKEGFIKKGKIKNSKAISSVVLTIPVESIKSERGATMDGKTHRALKYETNPNIYVKFTENEITSLDGDTFLINALGTLNLAGTEKKVNLEVSGTAVNDNTYAFKGSYKLNMKDYDMVPPSAMFGQIVTGPEVTVNFELMVSK
ncbi:MAG: YceI family protein [Cyclobacteriaceae bacterium]